MATSPFLPVNFDVSPEAWAEIERLRIFWDGARADKADVLMIGWGTTKLHDGTAWSHVVVSFYGTSERFGIEDSIQRISGQEIIFFVLESDYHRFDDKNINFDQKNGFYLS